MRVSLLECCCVCGNALGAGLRALLSTRRDLEVVAPITNPQKVVHDARHLNADIVVLDLTIHDLDPVETTCRLTDPHAQHRARLVLLAEAGYGDVLAAAIRAGARAAVLREGPIHELIYAINAVASMATYVARPLMGCVLDALAAPTPAPARPQLLGSLSRREHEVLELIALGRANADIAFDLRLSVRTVKYHVSNILKKLSLKTRGEAIALATRATITSGQPDLGTVVSGARLP